MREFETRRERGEDSLHSRLLRESQLLGERPRDLILLAQARAVEATELRQPIINYCRAMLTGAGPAGEGGIRPGRTTDTAERLLRQIAGIFNDCTDQADRERVAGQLCTLLNNGNLRGYQFNLQVVAGSNHPSRPATIEGTFTQTVGARTETVRIVPIPIDGRFWNEATAQRLNGLIREYFGAGEAGGVAAAIRARFRALWRRVPAGQRETVRTRLNALLQTHKPPLYIVHPPRQAGRPEAGLNLDEIEVRQGNIPDPAIQVAQPGDNPIGNRPVPVGEMNERQRQQRDARLNDREERGWFTRFWEDEVPLGWQLTAYGVTGVAALMGLRAIGKHGLSGIGSGIGRGLSATGRGLIYTARQGWRLGTSLTGRGGSRLNRDLFDDPMTRTDMELLEIGRQSRTITSTPEPVLTQVTEEATEVSARQPLPLSGTNAEARRLSVLQAFGQAQRQNRNSRFFNPEVITDYRAACLEFINDLRGEATPANRANLFQAFIRETGARLFPQRAQLFNRIHIVENPHLGGGATIANHTLVLGSGGQVTAINIELPTTSLTGPITDAQLHETLGSLYDQLYRIHRVAELSGPQATHGPTLRNIRLTGNALADFIQFSVNADNTVVVGAHANEARLALNSSRPLVHAPQGHMEMTEHGLVMRNASGRELTEEQLRQFEIDRVAEEVRRLQARRTELQTRIDNATEDSVREALRAEHATLTTQLTATQAQHAALTSPNEAVRAPARLRLHEAFRRAFERGRARLGGRLVPITMFAEEAVRYFLTH
ncbi:MAG: hypothetical protein C5B53_04175 [Candidatus Melainabacteria bacterium]|nr:MAG: hypothetical protein C5B53_04175 [Candidatus Melainabacteria bacterium]